MTSSKQNLLFLSIFLCVQTIGCAPSAQIGSNDVKEILLLPSNTEDTERLAMEERNRLNSLTDALRKGNNRDIKKITNSENGFCERMGALRKEKYYPTNLERYLSNSSEIFISIRNIFIDSFKYRTGGNVPPLIGKKEWIIDNQFLLSNLFDHMERGGYNFLYYCPYEFYATGGENKKTCPFSLFQLNREIRQVHFDFPQSLAESPGKIEYPNDYVVTYSEPFAYKKMSMRVLYLECIIPKGKGFLYDSYLKVGWLIVDKGGDLFRDNRFVSTFLCDCLASCDGGYEYHFKK